MTVANNCIDLKTSRRQEDALKKRVTVRYPTLVGDAIFCSYVSSRQARLINPLITVSCRNRNLVPLPKTRSPYPPHTYNTCTRVYDLAGCVRPSRAADAYDLALINRPLKKKRKKSITYQLFRSSRGTPSPGFAPPLPIELVNTKRPLLKKKLKINIAIPHRQCLPCFSREREEYDSGRRRGRRRRREVGKRKVLSLSRARDVQSKK